MEAEPITHNPLTHSPPITPITPYKQGKEGCPWGNPPSPPNALKYYAQNLLMQVTYNQQVKL